LGTSWWCVGDVQGAGNPAETFYHLLGFPSSNSVKKYANVLVKTTKLVKHRNVFFVRIDYKYGSLKAFRDKKGAYRRNGKPQKFFSSDAVI
jgi:hypothetical protein